VEELCGKVEPDFYWTDVYEDDNDFNDETAEFSLE
jgi:hypothetical protein